MKASVYIFILFAMLFTSCNPSIINDKNVILRSQSASDLSVFQNNLIVVGSTQLSENAIDIKSPYVIALDSSLNIINSKSFKTKTTVLNVQLDPLNKTKSVLSFYAARSLEHQEEQSHIKILDQDLGEIKSHTYGNRTRIKDLIVIDNSDFITLNYERSNRESSLKSFTNFRENFTRGIKESSETNIPVALTLLSNDQFVLSGIANGFHYLDGHNYENLLSYGFIRKLNQEGEELNKFNYQYSGHVFLNDNIYSENSLFVIGSKHNEDTGMDLLILRLDDQLNVDWEKTIPKAGIQEASKIISTKNSIYILGTTEDLKNHKMQLLLTKIDSSGNVIWQKTYGVKENSHSAVDIVFYKSNLILLSQSKKNRMSPKVIHLHKISTEGKILREVKLN